VVVAYEPAPGDRRLLAYVVPRAGAAPNASELRRFLERELPPFMVPSAFIPIDALPLSSNGKVDHARLPEPGDDRAPLAEEYVAPQSPLQQRLADIMAAVIGLAQVGAHDNFFELGGDSILAIQFVARAQAEGITLTPLDLFASPTVAELAELAEATGSPSAGQNDPAHGTPLTPQQRRFCTTTTTNPHHWTTSTLLELHTAYQPPELREAVDRLLDHHDSLRQRFQLDGGRTRVTIAPPGDETPFEVFDLSDLDDSEQTRTLYTLTGKMQTTLDLTSGPVIRVALFRLRARRGNRLAIVAHRLTVDDVSMRILCEDLQTACAQLVAGKQVALPRSVSWQSWVRRLAAHAGSPSVRSQREYWSQVVMAPAGRLPVDTTEDADADTAATDSAATVQTVVASLDRERTNELLHSIPDSLSCRVEDVLLAALARILTSWTGAHRHTIDLVSRGRAQILDGVDLARTVGWLEVVHPLALKCESDSSPAATLRTTKETLRDVPSGGVGWQLLRQDPDHVPDTPAQIAFSYVEPSDQFRPTSGDFIPASEPLSSGAGRIDQRTYPIEIHFRVVDDQLVAQWRYHENLHTRQTLTELAGKLLQEIHAMIELSRTEEAPGRTPSDFPLARIDQAELDTLLSRLASGQEPR
jgi:non-ribosomal peptide synthase protein (TIGR01720 family)